MYKGNGKLKFSELKEMMDAAYEEAVNQAIDEAKENGYEWDGTLQDDWATFLDDIDDSINAKKAGMIQYIKGADNDIAFLKQEKKNLDARIKSIKTKVQGYSSYLDIIQNGEPFECGAGVIKYTKSTKTVYSKEIEEALAKGEVPKGYEEYCSVSQVVKMPKPLINKVLKTKEIEGIERVSTVTMKIQ